MNIEDLNKDVAKKHQIWWDFCDYMKEWYSDEDGNFDSEKMVGYDALERVDAYANAHPEIVVLPCDDDHFTGADIVLIPHPKMGVTVIFIPQCGTSLNRLFLYPGHIKYLLQKISELNLS